MSSLQVICPSCNTPARLTNTKYGPRHDCYKCDLHSWDGKPLVTKETMKARKAAHKAFDLIWQRDKLLSRQKAYVFLSAAMKMSREDCHIAQFSLEQALLVPKYVKELREALALRTPEEETQDRSEREEEIRTNRAKRAAEKEKQSDRNRGTKLNKALAQHPLAPQQTTNEEQEKSSLPLLDPISSPETDVLSQFPVKTTSRDFDVDL